MAGFGGAGTATSAVSTLSILGCRISARFGISTIRGCAGGETTDGRGVGFGRGIVLVVTSNGFFSGAGGASRIALYFTFIDSV